MKMAERWKVVSHFFKRFQNGGKSQTTGHFDIRRWTCTLKN